MNTARCSACNQVVRLPHAKSRASRARCEECHRRAAGGYPSPGRYLAIVSGGAPAAEQRDKDPDPQLAEALRWRQLLALPEPKPEPVSGENMYEMGPGPTPATWKLRGRVTMVSTPPASSPEAAWWKREVELEDAAAEREAHSYDETDAYDDRVAVSNWLTPAERLLRRGTTFRLGAHGCYVGALVTHRTDKTVGVMRVTSIESGSNLVRCDNGRGYALDSGCLLLYCRLTQRPSPGPVLRHAQPCRQLALLQHGLP